MHAPLWRVSYRELTDDLMASGTPIRVCAVNDAIVGADTDLVENQCGCGGGEGRGKKRSLSTSPPAPLVQVGEFFDRALLARLEEGSWDTFGENGEFHSLALVWECILPDALLGQATTGT
uniref:Uncharacterized protein n=1 Tax=Noctiluca scintillans TaxID=2966 RepID=A0A7S0ZNQ1_NOCSC